jgi:hypothetical protein
MEEEEHAAAVDGNECDDTETVKPAPIDTFARQRIVHSPTVPFGLLHKDHSDNADDTDVHVRELPAQLLASASKFPETKFILHDPNTNTSMNEEQATNVTLPLSKLLEFLNTSFKCGSCNSAQAKKITLERYGIASSIYFKCVNCGLATSCRADLRYDLETKWESKPPAKHFKDAKVDPVNGSDFDLNNKLYLATQQCGRGLTKAKVFSGVLGMNMNVLRGRWKEILEQIGLNIIEIGEECIRQNLSIEIELSPLDETTGRNKISACGDCCWDKRSSGKRYDSMSGCSVMIGCRNQLVIGIEPMSNACSKCARNIPHDIKLCPKNVDWSSKAMKAIGSSRICQNLLRDYNAYIYEYVGDDDALTNKVPRHSWENQVIAGTLNEVPRYKDGRKKNR